MATPTSTARSVCPHAGEFMHCELARAYAAGNHRPPHPEARGAQTPSVLRNRQLGHHIRSRQSSHAPRAAPPPTLVPPPSPLTSPKRPGGEGLVILENRDLWPPRFRHVQERTPISVQPAAPLALERIPGTAPDEWNWSIFRPVNASRRQITRQASMSSMLGFVSKRGQAPRHSLFSAGLIDRGRSQSPF